MRIAAISLPDLHVEVVRANARANAGAKTTAVDPELHAHAQADAAGVRVGMPLAIVVAPAPLTEAKLLGNTRLDVVSREARALGVQPGQTIAQARARAANLAVRVVRPEAVQGVLARLAEVSLAFGATVSFSFSNAGSSAKDAKDGKGKDAGASASHGDVVWVDVTGCAHLHAPRERDRTAAATANDGEAILAARLASVFGGLGHSCAVAIADGPRVAAILARAAASARASASARAAASIRDGARPRPSDHRFEDDDPPLVVVPSGKNAIALAPLPVSALPIGADDARWLAKLGVRTIGELRALPRSALASRLGVRAPVIIGLAEGDDRAPLTSYVPPEIPEEETTLEYGVEGSEALTFVAKTLSDRLATRLAGRAVAASRIELDLVLDVALLRDQRDSGQSPVDRVDRIQRIAIELPAPLSSASDLLAALRPKIERAVLRAPVLAAKLRAASLVHKPQAALSLFESQPKAERALPRLVAELAADLGVEAVGKLALGDACLPEERSRFVRLEMKAKSTSAISNAPSSNASSTRSTRPRRHMLASVPEPTRIL
ncbi:MAG: polymerase IV-like protein ImuB, partial [Myxococcaceae bacterium]|nr:polymerase IV-like protein ImuB [Myxococcaceae bacterium]